MTTLFLFISALLIFAIIFVLIKHLSKLQAIIISIAMPLITVFIYLAIGQPQALNSNHLSQNINPATSMAGVSQQQVAQAIAKLNEEIEQDPENIEKLNLLANSYILSGSFELAATTLQKLIALDQNDINTILKTADSLSRASGGAITPEANALINQALTQDPNHPQALWLASMAAAQQGQNLQATDYLNKLLPLLAGTEQEAQVQQIIDRLNTANNEQPQQKASKTIALKVTIDEATQTSIPATASVFVFARAQNGPPAPLAAKRLTVADLPADVTLSEQDAMLPNLTIAKFTDIELSAKVSLSGNPADKTGDINSNIVQFNEKDNSSQIELHINKNN